MHKNAMSRGQAVGAILGLAAAAMPARSQAQTLQYFKAAATPIEADSLIWLAQSQGYLQKAGLSLDIQSLASGDAVAAAMIGGDIVIGSMNIISLALAHQNGVDLKIVAGCTEWESGHGGSQLMVKQDSSINGGAALIGKTIAINVLRGLSQMVTSAWIDKHGGDSTKVQFVEMPFAAMQPALEQGRVAAAQISQPWATGALSTCRSLGPPNDAIASRFLLSAYIATGTWAASHKDVIRRFQSALSSCAHWIDTQPSASIGAIAELTKQDPAVVARSVRSLFSEGLSPAAVQPILDAAAKYGVLKAAFPASEMMA
jgi:ABC-type nitrate/sulfonate/bicarbonate transport system substrate-binding protein